VTLPTIGRLRPSKACGRWLDLGTERRCVGRIRGERPRGYQVSVEAGIVHDHGWFVCTPVTVPSIGVQIRQASPVGPLGGRVRTFDRRPRASRASLPVPAV